MFGKNAVSHIMQRPDGSLIVNSMWYTIQGEGPDAGCPAIFLRLSKCNLRCWFCDTEFEKGKLYPVDEVTMSVRWLAAQHKCNLVVLTGGEPMLQNIVPLIRELNLHGIRVSIETAGTVYVNGLETLFRSRQREHEQNLIVCSPKTPKLDPRLINLLGALKYIVKAGELDPEDGLPTMSTQLRGEPARVYRPSSIVRSTVPIYLQPTDEEDLERNAANLKAAAAACMKHGYRLSCQLHKLANLP